MTMTRKARVTAWVIGLLSLGLAVASSVVTVASGVTLELGLLAWVWATPVLGLILVVRVGALRMGALMLAIGLAGSLAYLGASMPSDPAYLAWLPVLLFGDVGWTAFLALTIAGLPLLFPTGYPLGPRWRPVLIALLVLLVSSAVMATFSPRVDLFCSDAPSSEADCATWQASGEALAIEGCEPVGGSAGGGVECTVVLDNPVGVSQVPELEGSLVGNVAYAGLLTTSVLAIISLAIRLMRAGGQERQQIKFLFVAIGGMVVFTIVEVVVEEFLDGSIPGSEVIEFLLWSSIPISIFLAISRYRLYDIDRIISRTVSYGVVVALLAGIVAIVAGVVGTRFSDPLVVAATTLAVAAAFNPLRIRVQRMVDRRFDRSRYDAEWVISEFAATLRDRVDPGGVVNGWTDVVANTMQPASLGVWTRS